MADHCYNWSPQYNYQMDPQPTRLPSYKYVLYPGNNPLVIQDALQRRKVWSALPPEKISWANLVWKPLNYPHSVYQSVDEMMRFDKTRTVLLNHFENNTMICTKSGLVRSLKHYYSHENAIYEQNYHIFETIPTTFVVNPNKDSPEYKDFLERFADLETKNYVKQKMPSKHCEKNIWYVKPQASNQGRGITVTNSLKQIQSIIFAKATNTSYILQKAVERPLLIGNRKFDVRVWALVTANLQIYFYKVPYIRTSSYEYDDSAFDGHIHLTNNCQQKHFSEYSKYEQGNTIPFENLKSILLEMGKPDAQELTNKVMQRMKSLVLDCVLSVRKFFLRGSKKKQFELFGFDFLIDEDLRTWLLEVNNNPYLGIPNKFIKQLLPQMINEMFEIVLDPLFPPVDYEPVSAKNYELLHKQVSFFRISPVRSGSTDTKRKDYYPMEDFSANHSRQISTKSRRNSQGITFGGSFHAAEKGPKVRYSTPVQTIRYLLDTYCFNDLEPFIVPVNLILSSPKLEDEQMLESSLRSIKLISQTRICHILLEPKFVLLCQKILQSPCHSDSIKVCIINGYANAIRSHKNRVTVIKNIVPVLKQILKSTAKQQNNNSPNGNQSVLAESIILLLVRLGGIVNRKLFIPGQSREKETSRQFFIISNTLKLLMGAKQSFPALCTKQINQLLANLNQSDWQLYKSVEKNDENYPQGYSTSKPEKLLTDVVQRKSGLQINIAQDNQRRPSGYRERLEQQYLKNILKMGTTTPTLPKIKK